MDVKEGGLKSFKKVRRFFEDFLTRFWPSRNPPKIFRKASLLFNTPSCLDKSLFRPISADFDLSAASRPALSLQRARSRILFESSQMSSFLSSFSSYFGDEQPPASPADLRGQGAYFHSPPLLDLTHSLSLLHTLEILQIDILIYFIPLSIG